MAVVCKRCRAVVPADDVDLARALAKCRACNAIFDFTDQVERSDGLAAPRRPRVPMPNGITVDEGAATEGGATYRSATRTEAPLVITRRWFTPKYLGLLFFCIAWDSFLVFWYSVALVGDAAGKGAWIALVFPIAHVAVGVGLTYSTIAGLVNRTRIAVAGGKLTVRHGPIPWRGNRDMAVDEVEQLYCEQTTTSSKNRTSTSYGLSALMKDGRKVELLKSLDTADQALFVEQRVEERLGIADAPVGGEYRP